MAIRIFIDSFYSFTRLMMKFLAIYSQTNVFIACVSVNVCSICFIE